MLDKAWQFIKWRVLEPYINLPLFAKGTEGCDICFAARLMLVHTLAGVLIGGWLF